MFERYAIFYTPIGPLADFGARWLGWDSAKGHAVPHPVVDGVDVALVTATPRKYGLHGTLKAPFRLAEGTDLEHLQRASADFASRHPAFAIGQMELRHDAGFVALRPKTEAKAMQDFAATVVKALDPFRAPMGDADIARRHREILGLRNGDQRAQLRRRQEPDEIGEAALEPRFPAHDDDRLPSFLPRALAYRLPLGRFRPGVL